MTTPLRILGFGVVVFVGLAVAVMVLLRLCRAILQDRARLLDPLVAPLYVLALAAAFRACLTRPGLDADLIQTVLDTADGILLIAAIWLGGRLLAVLIFSVYFGYLRGLALPNVFRTVLAVAFYYIGAIAVLHGRYDYEVGDLIITSAVIGLVVGIAFQGIFGNLIAGLSVALDESLAPGDYIRAGEMEGWIEEKGTRTTTIRTADGTRLLMPNRRLVELSVVNCGRLPPRQVQVDIPVSVDLPPNLSKLALASCAAQVDGVVPTVAPLVRLLRWEAATNIYRVEVSIAELQQPSAVRDALSSMAWYRIRRELTRLHSSTAELSPTRVAERLRQVPIFAVLATEELVRLATFGVAERFGVGERLFEQGDPGGSMYVIERGRIRLTFEQNPGRDHEQHQLAVLGPGEFFGERALLTGEPRAGNATAIDDTDVIVIDKHAVRTILLSRTEIAERLSEILAEQDATRERLARDTPRTAAADTNPTSILARLRDFLGL